MTAKPQEIFIRLCEEAKKKDSRDLAGLFRSPEDMDEFEIPSFQNFLKHNEVAFHKAVAVGDSSQEKTEETDFVRVFYSYTPEKGRAPVSTEYTWFPFQKDPEKGEWKVSGKGAYLKRLSERQGWRRIDGEKIRHFFDYSIKKSMDPIHAGCVQGEYERLTKFFEEKAPDSALDYFVFDGEKSLPEIGLEAGTAGRDWVFSNHPCDLFQLCSHFLRRLNEKIPRFFLYGFSAYYAQFIAGGRYPVFNASKEVFQEETKNIMESIPVEKLTKLVSNVEFDRWAQYAAFFSLVSRSSVHPHTALLLMSCSFVKFLFESEETGGSPEERKAKILMALKKGTTEDFEDVFKKSMGLKLKKADKLWRKEVKR